jgi:hypothetical protein
MSNTPCFICLEENTEKIFPFCKCEYHAHKKCYKEHLEKNGTCPYCHTILRTNPMIEACQEPPTLFVLHQETRVPREETRVPREETRAWNSGANPFIFCCLFFLLTIGIIGGIVG